MYTELIKPLEFFTVDKLAASIRFQADAVCEARQRIEGGQSSCFSAEMHRLRRLTEIHDALLELHAHLGRVGESLFQLERLESPDPAEPDDTIPF